MAHVLSPTTQALAQAIDKEPLIIVDIEGSQYLYGTGPILETIKWDDDRVKWDNNNNYTWDGQIEKKISKPYINLKKTTKGLSQQLLVDKGGSGSISTMDIALIDYRGEVAQDLSFDQIGDPLGRRADVYLGLKGGRHPQDSVRIFRGFIDDLSYDVGQIIVSVSHPENLKRQSILEQHQSQITSTINAIVTTIPVTTVAPFIETGSSLTSYIRIDDEVMEVLSLGSNTFEVSRGALGTLIAPHEIEADVTSFYRLQGKPLDLALQLMLSSPGNEATTSDTLKIQAINSLSNVLNIPGALLINDLDVEDRTGLSVGDIVTIAGSASNDGSYSIKSFGQLDTGKSYIVLDGSFTDEINLDLNLIYNSQFNVLNDGLGLTVDQVDTDAFKEVSEIFSANFIDTDWYIKDTIENTKEFIDRKLFQPFGIYTIPRNAQISCKYTSAPFSIQTLPTLNNDNIVGITKVRMRRSTHKYLYNEIVYRYNEGVLEDKLFDKVIRLSADSANRIKAGRKRYAVDVAGVRRSSEAIQVLDRAAGKILDRYKFASRYITNVNVLFQVGMTLEIGDIVFFGGEETQLFNLQTGARDLPIAQYEIINKRMDIGEGKVTLSLLETGFSFENSTFGVFSPSSLIGTGATTSLLPLEPLFSDCSTPAQDRLKWEQLVGLKVRIRSEDYTYDETTTLDRLDPVSDYRLILDPPLSSAPPAGAVIELAEYTEYGDEETEQLIKLKYTFTTPQAEITSVVNSQEFDVDTIDGFKAGQLVAVHSEDYIRNSEGVRIDTIIGNTITLTSALNITPQIGDKLELLAYDNAKGYRFL